MAASEAIPADKIQKPVFRLYNYRDMVRRLDPSIDAKTTAYRFSNGREFKHNG